MTLTSALLVVSLLWLVMGSTINKLQRIYLTEPMIALVVGVLLGPVFSLIEVPKDQEHVLLEWGAKLTITMALMAAALRFKHSYLVDHRQMLSVLVMGGMLLMFGSSALISKYVLDLGWAPAILIGTIITPTDPVISSSMITGKYADKYLNNNLKSSLLFESGINDGLAFPLVAIGWSLMQDSQLEWEDWLLKTVGYENVLASLLGAAIGFGAGKAMHYAKIAAWMTSKTLLSFSIGLGFFTLTLLEALKMNGIIGVFFAGLLFTRSIQEAEDIEEEKIQEAIERLFTIPVFFLLGLVLPWQEWLQMDGHLLLFVVSILLFRRLPALILLKPWLKQISHWPRILLLGWFGPIGVAALFYAMLSIEKTRYPDVFPIVAAVITGSVLIHGLTSIPASRLYSKWDQNDVEGDSEEENEEMNS